MLGGGEGKQQRIGDSPQEGPSEDAHFSPEGGEGACSGRAGEGSSGESLEARKTLAGVGTRTQRVVLSTGLGDGVRQGLFKGWGFLGTEE